MPGFGIPLLVDKEGGTKQINDWLASQNPEVPVDLKIDNTGVSQDELDKATKAIGDQAKAQLKGLGEAAEKAKDSTDKLFDLAKTQEYAGALGDINDILQRTGKELLGLKDSQLAFAGAIGETAQKGASVGAVLGPLGALAGALAGGLIGYFSEAKRQAEEARKALRDLENQATVARDSVSDIRNIDLGNLVEQINSLNEALAKSKEGSDYTKAVIEDLIQGGYQKILGEYEGLLRKSGETFQEAKAILLGTKPTLDEAADAAKEANKQFEFYNQLIKNSKESIETRKTAGELYGSALEYESKQLAEYANMREAAANKLLAAVSLVKQLKDEQERDKTPGARKVEEEETRSPIRNRLEEQEAEAERALAIEAEFLTAAQDAIDDANAEKLKREEARLNADFELQQQHFLDVALLEEEAVKESLRLQEEAIKARQSLEEESIKHYEEQLNTLLLPAVQEVTGTLYDNIEQGKRAFEGFGQSVARGISEALKALGKQFAVQAIGEAASGLASLALGPVGGVSAGMHFAAAAGYAAAALAAGLGGALVGRLANESPGATPAPAPSGGSSDRGFTGGPGGQGRSFVTDVKAPLVINVSGVPFGALSLRELAAIGGRITEASEAYYQNGGSIPE